MKKFNLNIATLLFIIATIPLLAGPGLPLTGRLYISLTLMAAGSWLIAHYSDSGIGRSAYRPWIILIILASVILTTIHLPLDFIALLSPVRGSILARTVETGPFIDVTTSLSYFYPESRFYVLYGLSLFLLFYYSSALLRAEKNLKTVLWAITLAGTAEAVLGILQASLPEARFLTFTAADPAEGLPVGTFGDRHLYAAFLNMCWPVSFVLGLALFKRILEKVEVLRIKNKEVTIFDRIRLAFDPLLIPLWTAPLMMAAVILTGSGSGIIILFLLILFVRHVIPYPGPVKIIFSGAIYACLLLYGWAIGIQGIISRSGMFFQEILARFDLWHETVVMLRDHLYTGIGLGAFPLLAPVYLSSSPDSAQGLVHNDYLELALELGLPLFVLLSLSGSLQGWRHMPA